MRSRASTSPSGKVRTCAMSLVASTRSMHTVSRRATCASSRSASRIRANQQCNISRTTSRSIAGTWHQRWTLCRMGPSTRSTIGCRGSCRSCIKPSRPNCDSFPTAPSATIPSERVDVTRRISRHRLRRPAVDSLRFGEAPRRRSTRRGAASRARHRSRAVMSATTTATRVLIACTACGLSSAVLRAEAAGTRCHSLHTGPCSA
jgi:hypothetical protein